MANKKIESSLTMRVSTSPYLLYSSPFQMKQFQLVGRACPTPKNPSPKIYRMTIFARNVVLAKSKFWLYMKRMTKAKLTGGEMLAVNEIHERKPLKVKNFGIWLKYMSRSGTHNMYKEFRDLTLTGAVGQLYQDMAGRHRALPGNIHIIKTTTVADADVRSENLKQYIKPKCKYPVVGYRNAIAKEDRVLYSLRRPRTYKSH
jgi:large subunit ribosomal protein L18Ae